MKRVKNFEHSEGWTEVESSSGKEIRHSNTLGNANWTIKMGDILLSTLCLGSMVQELVDAAISPVEEPDKYVRTQALMFMAPTQSTETQKRCLTILKRIRNAPKEEGEDTQSETNTMVIDEPLQQTNPN